MDSIKLTAYHWERTLLHLDVDTGFSFKEGDVIHLVPQEGSLAPSGKVIKAQDMTGVRIESPQRLCLRPMVGNQGNPVLAADYRILVRRGKEQAPILATREAVHPKPATFKRDDIMLFNRSSSFYQVVPTVRNGELWLHIEARGVPMHFYYEAGRSVKNAAVSLAKSIVSNSMVGAYYVFRALCRINPKKITFTSDSRVNVSGNMEPLYKRMEERGIMQSHKVRTSFKQSMDADRRSLVRYLQLAHHMATSQVIFCDDFQPYLYHVKLRPGQRLVQLWHACGHFKTVGFGRVGTLDAGAPFTNNHRTYTDVIVASETDVPYYAEAFGITDDKVRALGIPRHDWLLDTAWQEARKAEFSQLFPKAQGKKVIVFAPTFRGSGKRSAYYEYSRWDFSKLAEFCRANGYFFIFKLHPFITEPVPLPANSDDVFADGTPIREINDILPSTDILITDYSSVVYEASLLDIPTLYFAYDLEDYVSSRDFYEPYESFVSGPIVRSFDELLQRIEDENFDLERLEAFKKKNFKYLDSGSCDRIIDQIILGKAPQGE